MGESTREGAAPGAAPASAAGKVTLLKSFDFRAQETAENVVVLTDGTICTTLAMAGAVWLSTGATERVVPGANAIAVGLASDADDRLYVALRSSDADVAGVWRRDAAGRWARFAAADASAGLNGITFDEAGALFAADSVNGEILCLPRGQKKLELWLAGERLKPTSPADPVSSTGVNGVKFWGGSLYATNTARGTFLRIETHAGRPGEVSEVHSGIPADDFAFDSLGNLYLAVHPEDTVQRIAPGGTATTLATAGDGLDGPSAVAVVTGGLVVTNFGALGARHTPSLLFVSTEVGAPVLPRPKLTPLQCLAEPPGGSRARASVRRYRF